MHSRVAQQPSPVGGNRAYLRRDPLCLRRLGRRSAVGRSHACGDRPIGHRVGHRSADHIGHEGATPEPDGDCRSGSCPTGATVGAALGITLPNAISV